MFNLLKPYIGPAALIALERGFDALSIQISEFWAGALIGFAAIWLFIALASHKELVKKFPGIRQWLPFVDPTGAVHATPDELSGRFITGKTFSISSMAYGNVIANRTFEDCDICGPAVLYLEGVGVMHGCAFDAPPEVVLISTDQNGLIGPIRLINCSFRLCRFHGIGFIGPRDRMLEYANGIKPFPQPAKEAISSRVQT